MLSFVGVHSIHGAEGLTDHQMKSLNETIDDITEFYCWKKVNKIHGVLFVDYKGVLKKDKTDKTDIFGDVYFSSKIFLHRWKKMNGDGKNHNNNQEEFEKTLEYFLEYSFGIFKEKTKTFFKMFSLFVRTRDFRNGKIEDFYTSGEKDFIELDDGKAYSVGLLRKDKKDEYRQNAFALIICIKEKYRWGNIVGVIGGVLGLLSLGALLFFKKRKQVKKPAEAKEQKSASSSKKLAAQKEQTPNESKKKQVTSKVVG